MPTKCRASRAEVKCGDCPASRELYKALRGKCEAQCELRRNSQGAELVSEPRFARAQIRQSSHVFFPLPSAMLNTTKALTPTITSPVFST